MLILSRFLFSIIFLRTILTNDNNKYRVVVNHVLNLTTTNDYYTMNIITITPKDTADTTLFTGLTKIKITMPNKTNTVTNNNQQMEYQLIEKMLDHYSQKKLIYEATVEYYSTKSNIRFYPYIKHYFDFDNVDTFKNSDGSLKTFVIDSYTFEPKYNNIKVKFIEW